MFVVGGRQSPIPLFYLFSKPFGLKPYNSEDPVYVCMTMCQLSESSFLAAVPNHLYTVHCSSCSETDLNYGVAYDFRTVYELYVVCLCVYALQSQCPLKNQYYTLSLLYTWQARTCFYSFECIIIILFMVRTEPQSHINDMIGSGLKHPEDQKGFLLTSTCLGHIA